MECRGVVEKVENGRALVRLLRSKACEGCPGCSFLSSKDRNMVDLELTRAPGLKKGDEVAIHMPNRRFFSAFALVFGVPLLATVVTYGVASLLVGMFFPGAPGALPVLLSTAAGLLAFYLASKRTNRPSFEPTITIQSRSEGEGGDEDGGLEPGPTASQLPRHGTGTGGRE